jgi:hypothetical protein
MGIGWVLSVLGPVLSIEDEWACVSQLTFCAESNHNSSFHFGKFVFTQTIKKNAGIGIFIGFAGILDRGLLVMQADAAYSQIPWRPFITDFKRVSVNGLSTA